MNIILPYRNKAEDYKTTFEAINVKKKQSWTLSHVIQIIWCALTTMTSSHNFNGVRGTSSYIFFVDHGVSFCPLSFGHCILCSSSIFWYIQICLQERKAIICNHPPVKLCKPNLPMLFKSNYLPMWFRT